MAAKLPIQTYVNDLRITEKDIGGVLTVNEQCNVEWTTGPSITAGEVWQYTKITQDCYIILPRAELFQGYCVAILRGKTPENKNPGVVIVPYSKTNNLDGLDIIQGTKHTFYHSAGVAVSGNTIAYGQADTDDYSSIIFKSVNISTDIDNPIYSWIVINGVGKWDGETIEDYELYTNIASGNQVIVSPQTAGINTLTAGLQTASTEFNEIISSWVNPYSIISENTIEPFSDTTDVSNYFIGSFQGETSYYTEISGGNINYIGATPTTTGLTFNSLNNYAQIVPFSNSYTYQLKVAKRTLTSDKAKAIQISFNININEIKLKGEKTITDPRNLYVIIQNFISNQSGADSFIYKLPAQNSSNTPLLLKSSLTDHNSIKNGSGSLITVPITKSDIENNTLSFIIEFIVNTDKTSVSTIDLGVNYFQLKFLGIEQIKPAEVSPDVDFANFGYADCNNIGTLYENGEIKTLIDDCYIDANTNVGTYFGGSMKLKTPEQITIPLFNDTTAWRPDANVTKTILEYKNKYSRLNNDNVNDDGFIESKLIIDWAQAKFQFTSTIRTGEDSLQCATAGTFSDLINPDFVLKYYYGELIDETSSKYIDFKNCLYISSEGLAKFPYYCFNSIEGIKNFSFAMNITNYRTMTNNMEGNMTQPPVELLCHYKCGWERAEGIWTSNFINDGSEWDGLLSNDIIATGSDNIESPSKKCIITPHKRQTESTFKQTNFGTSGITFDNDTGLLPYVGPMAAANIPERYFSTRFGRYTNSAMTSYSPVGNAGRASPTNTWGRFYANDFVYLDFTPTVSGILVSKITVPLAGIGTGYIIFAADLLSDNSIIDGTFRQVKSYNKLSGTGLGEIHNFDIEFTDKAVANQKTRYYVIIYNAPVINESGARYEGYNGIIARSYGERQNGGITPPDFKTFYDNRQAYQSIDGWSNNTIAESRGNNTVSNIFFGSDKGHQDGNNALPLEKISQLLYGKSKDSSLVNGVETTHQNWGFTFEFLAYVLRNG